MTFEEWIAKVDAILISICGLGHSDLPDMAYWDSWDDGVTPQEMVEDVLEDNHWPMEEND